MGTNYYVVRNRPTVQRPYHIGKSSIGWMFLFQTQHESWSDPPVVWNTWDEVKEWLYKYTVEDKQFLIMDEYDEAISYDVFVGIVEAKQNDERCNSNPRNFEYCRNVGGYRFSDEDFC